MITIKRTMPISNTIDQNELNQQLVERFKELPKVIQGAITSASVQQRLRQLSTKNHLHLDQWGALENEVMLTLLGFQDAENLATNIQKHVGLPPEIATPLTEDIMKAVFEPIRQELERELDHPEAQAVQATEIETASSQAIAQESGTNAQTPTESAQNIAPAAVPVAPVVPPQPLAPVPKPPESKAERAPIATTYTSAPSHERKTIEGDPYREQIS